MKLTWKLIKTLLISSLLLILGVVVGYRFGTTGKLPFGLTKPFQAISEKATHSSSLANLVGNPEPPVDKEVDFDIFWEVWSFLERDYLEPEKLNTTQMVDGAIAGMTASLGDPYTMYLPAQDNLRSGEDLAGSFYGVGIELGYVDSTLAVVAPLNGTPADAAGIQAGDLILHVRDDAKNLDEDTTGWSLDEAVNKIRGKKGTEVVLTLWRKDNGGEPFEVSIRRGEIVVESVKLEFITHNDKRVAHLKISRFGDRTQSEWNQAVTKILAERGNLAGVILDMRNNPGGYFDSSIDIASEFMKNGTVVSQKGKVRSKAFSSSGKARLFNFPLVVLVNRGSASASEIVAGALRDNLGVKLVGEQTFGKGTVQDRRELSNGAGLHITVGRWLLPSGDWINKEGLPVDVEVKDDRETEEDEALLKAIEEL